MALCTICKNIDLRALLIACLQQCRDRQVANGEGYDAQLPSDNLSRVKYYDDIFEIEKSSGNCSVCNIIFQAFKKRKVTDEEEIRGLPILLRAFGNKIEVCFDTEEGLIKLCGLDVYMNEADVNKFFQVCKIKEDSSPPILKMIEKDPCSKESIAIASGWLRDCSKNHGSCKPPTEYQKPPKRLINVGTQTQNPFLVETSSTSQQLEWLSLSYCWGGEPSMKLTADTMNILRNGVPLSKFDPVIRDAILVTRALEITYIWIDALCIIQDPNGKDWNEQARKMNEIYGWSTVTLVVANSESVMNGFLKKRELQYIPMRWSSNTAEDSTDIKPLTRVFLSPEWNKSEDELDGPWSKRGWTMQEEQKFEMGVTKSLDDEVAKILTYSNDVSFGSGWLWGLDTFMKFKRFRDYLPRNLDYPLLSEPETFHIWYDLIEIFTQRKFKHISDRLNAISGLATIFGDTIRSNEYVAGLWKSDLIRGLMWHTNGAKLIPRQSGDNIRALIDTFPTWSWASVGYEVVENSHKSNNNFQVLSTVKNVRVNLFNQYDPFGGVKSGRVTITGPLRKVPRLYNKEWNSAQVTISKFEQHLSEIVENESRRDYSPPGGHFAALQMLEDVHLMDLLMLEATGEVSSGINVYRRVGVLTLRYFPEEFMAPPDVIATLQKLETSRTTRFGPREEKPMEQKGCNGVIAELKREPWETETVIIA